MRNLLKLFLLAMLGVALLFWDAQRLLQAPLPLTAEARFDIPRGQAFATVVDRLQSQQWLGPARTALYLRLHARFYGLDSQIKSGEYALLPGLNAIGAVALFVSGRTVLYEVRFIEGWTFAQALDAIRRHPQIAQTLTDHRLEAVMAALGEPDLHPEGQFFPDTYRFERDTTDVTLLRRALDMQRRVLADEWERRSPGLPYADAREALIMASIIEKETGLESERQQIAGVFVRRLRLGMRLQTDPTVIYGIGPTFDGNIRLRDLRTNTPYNTYMRGGLTPTPICLPGRASIHAALHPDDGSALFFVSRGDGSHVFSDTLDAHNAAVRRYQLGQP
ncbi:MAG TPA: endolytic transglycosylase MltG [Solimonas sp.]